MLKQRKPMSRGKGFKPKAPTRVRRRDRELPPATAGLTLHRGTYSASTAVQSDPKTVAHRNPHLLAMARGQPCLLQIAACCTNNSATTVACHGNAAIFGKAGARKADDEYTVWGCCDCHAWLDRGNASKTFKLRMFMSAHLRQVEAWRAIVRDTCQPPKDRAAAQWALDHLNATPVGV